MDERKRRTLKAVQNHGEMDSLWKNVRRVKWYTSRIQQYRFF